MIECVPNVSEGRRGETVDRIAQAIRSVRDLSLLDYSADPAHNRSVFTFIGDSQALERAVLSLFDVALPLINLRAHSGVHPRLGAVDVVPFVPLEGATLGDCVSLAKQVGSAVAERYQVPVYLYEEAARSPERRSLPDIRRGGFEKLADRMAAGFLPDFGPATPHATAGASAFGARMPLIAFNVNLATSRLDLAAAVARAVRQSSGGLPFVKALGLPLADRGIVQVSMNLTNYRETSIRRAFDEVAQEAERRGVKVLESEIIGLAPAAALDEETAAAVLLQGDWRGRIIERRIGS
jgi:glutamate formiminotransferase